MHPNQLDTPVETGYPLPWSAQTWLPGTPATGADPAEVVRGVRAIDPHGRTFTGTGRGGTCGRVSGTSRRPVYQS